MKARPGLRLSLVWAVFLLVLAAVFGKLVWVQLVNHGFYARLADEQQRGTDLLPTTRGVIYDRGENPLALSRDSFDIYCLPRLVKDPRAAARALAPVLGARARDLEDRITCGEKSAWLARGVSKPTATKALALGLTGVFAQPCEARVYPEGELACHVLGYVGTRDGSRAGVERSLDVYLEGLPGIRDGRADAAGRALPDLTDNFVPPMAGFGCILTIDKWCQYVAERELKATCEKYAAASGAVVIMRPRTGEVLALASYPTYDPNRYGEYRPECWRNNAVTTTIEPGSIIKPFLVAAALEEGAITPDDAFDCSQPIVMYDRYKITDVKPVKGFLSVADIIAHSSNIGVVQIGRRLGGRRYYEYLQRFGFGDRTGVSLPAESRGLIREDNFGRPLGAAYACFGQGFAATPLQITAAGCALANGGVLVKPKLVTAIVDENGRPVRTYDTEYERRVISPLTAARVLAMMERVVEQGGGKEARVAGYRIAGKTGTSEIADDVGIGYIDKEFNASFLGVAPAESPEVVIFVTVSKPRADYFGGKVAAPTFARIAADVLPALRVAPAGADRLKPKPLPAIAAADLALADVASATAVSRLSWMGLRIRVEGRGKRVLWTTADRGGAPPRGTVVVLRVGGGDETMPLLVGLTGREALRQLGPMGVRPTITGRGGWIVAQSPAPGARVNGSCRLTFGPNNPRPIVPVITETNPQPAIPAVKAAG